MLIAQKEQSLTGWRGKGQIHVAFSNQEQGSENLSRSKTNEKVFGKGQKREKDSVTTELLFLLL